MSLQSCERSLTKVLNKPTSVSRFYHPKTINVWPVLVAIYRVCGHDNISVPEAETVAWNLIHWLWLPVKTLTELSSCIAADQLPVLQTVTQCTDTQLRAGYVISHMHIHICSSSNIFPGNAVQCMHAFGVCVYFGRPLTFHECRSWTFIAANFLGLQTLLKRFPSSIKQDSSCALVWERMRPALAAYF